MSLQRMKYILFYYSENNDFYNEIVNQIFQYSIVNISNEIEKSADKYFDSIS